MSSRAIVTILTALIVHCGSVTDATAQTAVTAVRTGVHVGLTRLVLDLTNKVEFHTFTLANPYRVVVDLSPLEWKISTNGENRRGVISDLRFGHFDRKSSRMVLEVNGPVEVKRAFLLAPQGNWGYRFVLDLAHVDEAFFVNSVGAPRSLSKPIENSTQSTSPRRSGQNRVIVLDPGHGGADPGAIGVTGVYEKNVTLSAARELSQLLKKSGRYNVILTRNSDKFLRLRDRVSIARDASADIFISLHADAIKKRNVRGASVYTLSEKASDAEAAALATKENKADLIGGMQLDGESEEVTSILIDLVQRETMNLSAGFGNVVLPELGKRVRTLRNGRRFAGFAVLKAPDVPSVLVEMGYLSNSRDERLLSSSKGRSPIIEALARAIEHFFTEQDG
jgi:N-acetylmuramoyl-L-alanine amidase